METFAGSIEIVTATDESLGVPGMALSADVVPAIVGALYGITQVASITPDAQPTSRTPEAAWTGRDANNQDITVFLWRNDAP